jgi:hypothetical protein
MFISVSLFWALGPLNVPAGVRVKFLAISGCSVFDLLRAAFVVAVAVSFLAKAVPSLGSGIFWQE